VNQRAVLSYLLLNANRTVATSELIRALWNDDVPLTSRKMVHNALANLRRSLSHSSAWGKSVEISTRPPGYLLRVPPESMDVHIFQKMADDGRNELASGRFEDGSKTLHAALAVWRGPALADLAESRIDWPEIAALNAARLDVFEDRIEADLALGHHRSLVSELEPLLEAEPVRERLCGQLMLSLYRCGRQHEALRLYRRTQLALAEQFGLDPGRELQELEQAILHHDPALAWAEPAAPASAADADDVPGGSAGGPSGGTAPGLGGAPPAPCPHARVSDVMERKRISVLLVQAQLGRTRGLDDLEHADEALKALSSVIETAAAQSGGIIWATMGSSWCVLFGAPRAREDDPARAVRAAFTMQNDFVRALRDLRVPGSAKADIRAAVATGEAMVTYQPDDDRMVTAVTGEVMDACEELLSTVLPSEVGTCANTRRAISTDDAAPALLATRFVGREPEMKLLEELLTGVEQRRKPSLVTLFGEAGIGKSRLIAEFAQTVSTQGGHIRCLYGRSLPVDEGKPLRAAAEIVLTCAGITKDDPDAEHKLAEAVRRSVSRRDAVQVLAGLRLLTGLEQPSSPEASAEMFPAWCRFIEGISKSPQVLVFEDLHWASKLLLSFVENTVDNVGAVPLLIIATARPELLQTRPVWSVGRARSTIILGPLYDEITESLLASFASGTIRDSGVVAQIAGNPLFAREYARGLQRNASSKRVPPPEIVRSVITAKIDRLTLCEKVVLRNASIFGDTVWSGGLAALMGTEDYAAESILETLGRKGFVRRTANSAIPASSEYNFYQVLVRDIAYAQLPRADRIELHLRAANWLSTLPASHFTLLAEHYKQAIANCDAIGRSIDQLARVACRALAEAGRKAVSAAEHVAAISCYEGAIGICSPDDPLHTQLQFLRRSSEYSLKVADRAGWSREPASQ
jgi:DNA-binding SARP family transcriptional activator/class 3 adenylate cyclase